jgi:hypothetical protein
MPIHRAISVHNQLVQATRTCLSFGVHSIRSTARIRNFWGYRSCHFLCTLQLLSRKACFVKVFQSRDPVHVFADPYGEPLFEGIVTCESIVIRQEVGLVEVTDRLHFPEQDLDEAARAADATREAPGAVVASWLG